MVFFVNLRVFKRQIRDRFLMNIKSILLFYFSLSFVRCTRKTWLMAAKKSLAQLHPDLARQAVRWDPNFVSVGSNKKVKW